MAFALVYAAEHYVVDILLGWAYTLVAVWVVARVAERFALRRRVVAPARAGDPSESDAEPVPAYETAYQERTE
jgi:hypothetical protein